MNTPDIDHQIAQWRAFLDERRELTGPDGDELEDHLRGQIAELTDAGLQTDESFLIAVKRLGSVDEISREFAHEHSDRLWKQLVLPGNGGDDAVAPIRRRGTVIAAVCAIAAALMVKVPAAFGLDWYDDDAFYVRNFSLLALMPLAVYFAWRRRAGWGVSAAIAALFALGAVGANAFSLADDSQSHVLTAIHLPMALWLVVGLAYAGDEWRSSRARMDFIRFTGEWFIYYVLIALGGGVLTGFTNGIFELIDVDTTGFVQSWLLPCGAAGAVIVAAWLVEAKQSVVENMAPVLTRLFTPLFAIALIGFIVALGWVGVGLDVDRDMLILIDLLLAVVLGLLLYAISARAADGARPGIFDRLQFALVASALIIDAIVLLALANRINEWGFTPNRAAALGENIILLANLSWSAWLLLEFIRSRGRFAALERWQTWYISVYAAWAWAVVLLFPVVFDFA